MFTASWRSSGRSSGRRRPSTSSAAPLPSFSAGGRPRSTSISRQALAKIERGFERDLEDVQEMVRRGLIEPAKVLQLHDAIEPQLVRFPAIDPATFRRAVEEAFKPLSG